MSNNVEGLVEGRLAGAEKASELGHNPAKLVGGRRVADGITHAKPDSDEAATAQSSLLNTVAPVNDIEVIVDDNLIKQNNKMLTKAAMMGQQAQMNQKSAAQNHQKPGQQKRREGNVGQPRGKGGSH